MHHLKFRHWLNEIRHAASTLESLTQPDFLRTCRSMTTKTRNWLITLLILASPFLFFLGLVLFWTAEPLPPFASLPNSNGYDDLVKAGETVSSNSWNLEEMNEEQLRETVSANAEALSLARAAFSNQCRVPLQFSKGYLANHIQDLIALRNLAQAFSTEAKLAEKEDRFSDAAKSYLDVIYLGNESGRGGIVVDEMVGIAIRSPGTDQLQKHVNHLDAKSCRETAATLEMLEAQRQSWADTLQQENAWERRTFSNLRILVFKLLFHSTKERNYQRCVDTIKSTQIKQGQLLIDLAARAYELDKGHRPASLTDLVPEYLKAVPQDPFTGTNMVYSP
jgi:hypothetical protein